MPQGSVIGCKQLILYTNDLYNSSELFDFILFADDTNLYSSEKSLDHPSEKLNKWLGWIKQLKMKKNDVEIERMYGNKFD